MPTMEEMNEETRERGLAEMREPPHDEINKEGNYSKTNNNVCKHYNSKETKEEYILGNKVLVCTYAEKKCCPYDNDQDLSLGGEKLATICQSKGLIKKLE